jgi:glycosyltransferase involved in cell wall biosynthesis
MKKILISTDFYKPGYRGGGPIQSIYNLSQLISNDYIIKIITQNFDLNQRYNPYNLEVNIWKQQSDNSFVKYFSINQFRWNFMPMLLEETPDILYVNSFFSTSSQIHVLFTKIYNLLSPKKCKIVVAPRGEFDMAALDFKGLKKKVFLWLYELIFDQKIIFHATAELEKNFIQKIFSKSNVVIAHNVPKIPRDYVNKEKQQYVTNLVFFARISEKKNLKFAIESLSMLEIEGKITFNIAGPIVNKKYWDECRTIFDKLPKNIQCVYKGEINNGDIPKLCSENHYLYFPTFAENYGHVIYESLVCGLPVLISDNTPWEGKRKENGIFANSLENKDDFIKDIKFLHTLSSEEYENLSKTSYQTAIKSADFESLLKEYKNLFQ